MGEDWYRAPGHRRRQDAARRQLTYHGPGQLVGYPIMRVGDVPAFVATMERAIVDALGEEGIEARARVRRRAATTPASGSSERKIASIGVHVSRGVTAHGFAVNVDNDLAPFEWVVACGLPTVQMTSLAQEGSPDDAGLLPQAHGLPLRAGPRPPPAAGHPAAAGHRARRPVGTLDP